MMIWWEKSSTQKILYIFAVNATLSKEGNRQQQQRTISISKVGKLSSLLYRFGTFFSHFVVAHWSYSIFFPVDGISSSIWKKGTYCNLAMMNNPTWISTETCFCIMNEMYIDFDGVPLKVLIYGRIELQTSCLTWLIYAIIFMIY